VTTILSTRAVSRLAERHVRQGPEPVPAGELLRELQALDVDGERARAGIVLALDCGRLVTTFRGLAIPTSRCGAV
jgi:hypothetical protein